MSDQDFPVGPGAENFASGPEAIFDEGFVGPGERQRRLEAYRGYLKAILHGLISSKSTQVNMSSPIAKAQLAACDHYARAAVEMELAYLKSL